MGLTYEEYSVHRRHRKRTRINRRGDFIPRVGPPSMRDLFVEASELADDQFQTTTSNANDDSATTHAPISNWIQELAESSENNSSNYFTTLPNSEESEDPPIIINSQHNNPSIRNRRLRGDLMRTNSIHGSRHSVRSLYLQRSGGRSHNPPISIDSSWRNTERSEHSGSSASQAISNGLNLHFGSSTAVGHNEASDENNSANTDALEEDLNVIIAAGTDSRRVRSVSFLPETEHDRQQNEQSNSTTERQNNTIETTSSGHSDQIDESNLPNPTAQNENSEDLHSENMQFDARISHVLRQLERVHYTNHSLNRELISNSQLSHLFEPTTNVGTSLEMQRSNSSHSYRSDWRTIRVNPNGPFENHSSSTSDANTTSNSFDNTLMPSPPSISDLFAEHFGPRSSTTFPSQTNNRNISRILPPHGLPGLATFTSKYEIIERDSNSESRCKYYLSKDMANRLKKECIKKYGKNMPNGFIYDKKYSTSVHEK